MTVYDLERLYDYGYWANRKLFQAVAPLTAEQFAQNVVGSYGSIRNTLVHVLSAEWGWLHRCGGPARGPALKADDYPTLESLVKTWGTVEGYVRGFLSELKDEDLTRTVEFTNPRGEGEQGFWELSYSMGRPTGFTIADRLHSCCGRSATRPAISTCCSTTPRSRTPRHGEEGD